MNMDIKKEAGREITIIAEVSANHGQDFNRAKEMIVAAKQCGADAVKFQAYKPETLTLDINNQYFQVQHPKWGGQTLFELYKKAFTPWEWFGELKKITDDQGLTFLCTSFDKTSVDMLEALDISAHKIASFELVDLALIKYIAQTGKPLILSTGMADLCEIDQAVRTARESGADTISLLKCISSYPALDTDMNLRTIPHMKELFSCPIGLSDHSLGNAASICAIAFGATIIEKHFTLSKEVETPDSFFSVNPDELKMLIRDVRTAANCIGTVAYGATEEEKKNLVFRRSLFAVKKIAKGQPITSENVRSVRPGHGLSPKHMEHILNRKARIDIEQGTPLSWDLIE